MKQKLTRIMAAILLVCSLFTLSCFAISAESSQSVTYSDVIEDLKKDSGFKVSNYPAIEDDYSIQVIQIAESEANELFIYVYQPSALKRRLTVSSINISTSIGDSYSPRNYKLTKLSTNGVFAKYKVEDFVVKSDALRYYSIPSILRYFYGDIDDEPTNDNNISEVSFEVGHLWTVTTVNGNVSYNMTDEDVIEITNKYVGHLNYQNAAFFFADFTSSHYVAFSTDYLIEDLMEADVHFNTQYVCSITNSLYTNLNSVTYGDVIDHDPIPLDKSQILKKNGTGFFDDSYEYERIQSIDAFLKNEGANLNDETKKYLQGMKWVLRFYETSYTSSIFSTTDASSAIQNLQTVTEYTRVKDVTLLRLKFETDGVVYNLGVVDNKTTGSVTSDNNNSECDFMCLLKKLLGVILIAFLAIVLLPFIPSVVSFVVEIFKIFISLIISIITFPFKLLGNSNEKKK